MQYFRDRDGCTIINALVERRRYDPDFARRLLDHALDRGADWPSRRVAVLALENQLLSLAGSTPRGPEPGAIHEAAPLLVRLGFAPAAGAPCCDDVLKQGYTTTAMGGFFGELIRRLSRLAPVHRALMDLAAAPEAAARFRDVASQEAPAHAGVAPSALMRLSPRSCGVCASLPPKSTLRGDRAMRRRGAHGHRPPARIRGRHFSATARGNAQLVVQRRDTDNAQCARRMAGRHLGAGDPAARQQRRIRNQARRGARPACLDNPLRACCCCSPFAPPAGRARRCQCCDGRRRTAPCFRRCTA